MNEYLFVLDSKGCRLTSYLLGAHGDTWEELEARAKEDYPGNSNYLRGEEEHQQKFVSQGLYYVDGQFVEPVITPEEEEAMKKAQLKADFEKQRAELREALDAAFEKGDEETMAEIREDIADLEKAYVEGVAEDVQD